MATTRVYFANFNLFGGDMTAAQWFAHGIHANTLSQPYITAQLNGADDANYNPPGYTPGALTDAGAGTQMANWVRYHYAQLAATYAAAGKSFAYTIHWQNAGCTTNGSTPYANTSALCKHATDKVTTSPAAVNGYSTPFTKAGRTAFTANMTAAIAAFKSALDANLITYPVKGMSDFEDRILADKACAAAGDGWMTPAIADARYTDATDTVDGTNTLSAALAAKLDIGGSTFSYQAAQDMYNNPTNYKMLSWCSGLSFKVMDYAHNQAVRLPMRAAFTGIPCGVYNLCSSSSTNPQPGDKAYISIYTTDEIQHDVQSPVLFPMDAAAFENSQSTYVEQFSRYGVTYTGNIQTDMAALFVARSIAMMAAAGRASNKDQVPWIAQIGHVESFATAYYPGGGTYTVTAAEIRAIQAAGASYGVKEWIWIFTNPNLADLDIALSLLNEWSAPARAASRNVNLATIRDNFIAPMATECVDIIGVWDSNGLFSNWGWNHGWEAAANAAGIQSYATALFCGGENGDAKGGNREAGVGGTALSTATGAGVGYGSSSVDVVYSQFKGNSLMGKLIDGRAKAAINGASIDANATFRANTIGERPPANLLQWMDTTNLGNSSRDYLYKPVGVGGLVQAALWGNTGESVGMVLTGGTSNPIDCTAALTAEVWIGQPTSGGVADPWESGWTHNGSFTADGVIALPTNAGPAGTMKRYTQVKAANAAHTGEINWRCPVGGSGGPVLMTYLRAFNPARTRGIAVTPWYSVGSQSTYDMANDIVNSPLTTIQHYLDAVTYNQPGTKRVLIDITPGPNDPNETLKLSGAPPGAASYRNVVKYNVQTIIDRFRLAWTSAPLSRSASTCGFILRVCPPVLDPDNANITEYRDAMAELAATNSYTGSYDNSLPATWANLIDPGVAPTHASGGSDHNHLNDAASYVFYITSALAAINSKIVQSGGRSFKRIVDRTFRIPR